MPEQDEFIKDRNRNIQHLLNDDAQLDTAEAANFLRLSKQTLINWRFKRMGPPYVKYSQRKVNYIVRDLRQFRDNYRIVPEL